MINCLSIKRKKHSWNIKCKTFTWSWQIKCNACQGSGTFLVLWQSLDTHVSSWLDKCAQAISSACFV